jgi:hypothetical protein
MPHAFSLKLSALSLPAYCTILFAQQELAKASGLALKAKPIPRIYPVASFKASLLLNPALVLMSA